MEHKQIKISPRVIKHLGRDLITTSEVAIIELIKNSIDAKAPNIKLLLFEDGRILGGTENFSIPVLFPFLMCHYICKPCWNGYVAVSTS